MLKNRRPALAVAGLVTLAVLAGCTSGSTPGTTPGTTSATKPGPTDSSSSPSISAPTGTAGGTATNTAAPRTTMPAAELAFSPVTGSKNVNPAQPVQVTVAHGTLSAVSFTNRAGKNIAGSLSADRNSWKSAEVLGYGKDYTVRTTARAVDGKTVRKSAEFSTLAPATMTMPYLNTTAGNSITYGATYGVGFVVNVHFDEAIPNRAAAEKTLAVTTAPAVSGSWYWLDDQDVHWRPRTFYAPGTKVTVKATVFGKDLGRGLYGQADRQTHFTIGQKHVSIADDKTHHVKVYFGDKLVRDMPTSMGKGGTVHIEGHTISYWTQRGTYTVIGHDNPKIMDSRTYGLPLDKGGYREPIYWATRISTDGVFLHELKSTIPAQGHRDRSHGCLNLNTANSKWFYATSRIGDVVQVVHTGGTPLKVAQNGDWSLSWADWVKGSALH